MYYIRKVHSELAGLHRYLLAHLYTRSRAGATATPYARKIAASKPAALLLYNKSELTFTLRTYRNKLHARTYRHTYVDNNCSYTCSL